VPLLNRNLPPAITGRDERLALKPPVTVPAAWLPNPWT